MATFLFDVFSCQELLAFKIPAQAVYVEMDVQ